MVTNSRESLMAAATFVENKDTRRLTVGRARQTHPKDLLDGSQREIMVLAQ